MRILHIIGGLETGGAEAMLCKLISASDTSELQHIILSLTGPGTMGAQLMQHGAKVHCLHIQKKKPTSWISAIRAIRWIRTQEADRIQGWMYYGNIFASICALLGRLPSPVIWNVRHSIHDITYEKASIRWAIRIGTWLKKQPKKIIYNAQASAIQHEQLGFPKSKRVVIANGFDTEKYCPNAAARQKTRAALDIDDNTWLIGTIARNHPMKDYDLLIQTAQKAIKINNNIHWCCAGKGVNFETSPFDRIPQALRQHFHLLGERNDVSELMSGLDIYTQTSGWGEGFPNVVGEAMASGIPCVVTDIGDSALVIGDTGHRIGAGQSEQLLEIWLTSIELGKEKHEQLGKKARARIINEYSLAAIYQDYVSLYSDDYCQEPTS